MERRLKKAQASNKKNLVYKREYKDKEKELIKTRREAIEAKQQNASLIAQITDLRDQLAAEQRRNAAPRSNLYQAPSSNTSQQQNAQQSAEIRTLRSQVE